jgi:pSer/pThr/pTyr-binding forkhead associated (FHA) protein
MPTITVIFKGTTIAQYPVEAGKPFTIGRKAENDVVIDNLAVSGYHAKIDAVGDVFLLTDLQSKNGSFVNDRRITAHQLAHGDEITIGKHKLVFSWNEAETPQPAHGEAMDETMVMDTDEYRDLLKQSEAQPSDPMKDSVAVLSLLAGGSGDIGISKKLFKIGKSPSSDLQVQGFWVGQTAATISQRPGGYYLNYVEGIAKPKVNGKVVKDTLMLKEFDMIEIGKAKMQIVFKPRNPKGS